MGEPNEPYRPALQSDPFGVRVTYTYNVSSEEIQRGAESREKARVGVPMQHGVVTTISYDRDEWKGPSGNQGELVEP